MRNNTVLLAALNLTLTASLAFGAAEKPKTHLADPLHVPLFQGPGSLSLAAGPGPEGNGVHAMAGYAVAPGFALVGAGAYAQVDRCEGCTKAVRRHVELGAGWFGTSSSGRIREVFAGIGGGRQITNSIHRRFDPLSEEMRVTQGWYQQVHAQANLGKRGKIMETAWSLRLAGYRYTGLSVKDGDGLPIPFARQMYAAYLEPAYTLRLGYQGLKGEPQAGLSVPVLETETVRNSRVLLNWGIGFRL